MFKTTFVLYQAVRGGGEGEYGGEGWGWVCEHTLTHMDTCIPSSIYIDVMKQGNG